MSDTTRISVVIDMTIRNKMSEQNLTPTEAVRKGLEILFSDTYNNINSYIEQINSYKHINAIQEAKLSEFDTLKRELERVHGLLEDQKELDRAHMAQVQTLINEISSKEENIRLRDDKILLLSDANNNHNWLKKIKFW